VPETIDEAYAYGRTGNFFKQNGQRLRALLFGVDFSLNPRIEKDEFLKDLKSKLTPFITLAKDAKPVVDADLNVTIANEEAGENFDYELIFQEMEKRFGTLSLAPIKIIPEPAEAFVKQSEIEDILLNKIKDFLNGGKIKFSFNEDSWEVKPEVFKDWLIFSKNEAGEIGLALSGEDLKNYLLTAGADKINRPALNAKLEIVGGKVKEFQGNQDGQEIDWDQTFVNIDQEIFLNNKRSVELAVKITKATGTVGSLNDLGIKEIIGTGKSNFAGSPKNRRHNIATGAAALSGLLIKPGETFSVIKALGEINGETGYLQELVIKGDRTIPEYGGGLCQIGTTVFRAVLQSGLPILERRNHSYRVVYYEPAGTDATIYNPKPDLLFTNDTANHILIQARIVKDDVYFDFWGTKDERKVEVGAPVIYNIKSAGPTIKIETTDLKPGETQWLEKSSHAGADAYFDYKVTYPTGEVKEQRFSSHYIPWPAKMLVGKAIEVTPTSTTEAIGPGVDTVPAPAL
jgi:vancomycin resistance protein YoaR